MMHLFGQKNSKNSIFLIYINAVLLNIFLDLFLGFFDEQSSKE